MNHHIKHRLNLLTEVRSPILLCCKTLLLPSVQAVRGPKANFTVSTAHPLIKYFHIKSVLTFSRNIWAELDQNRKEDVLHVLFLGAEKVKVTGSLQHGPGQSREAWKAYIRLYSAHPVRRSKLGHWSNGTTAWGLSFSLWAHLFALCPANQHIKAPTMCQALRRGWLTF